MAKQAHPASIEHEVVELFSGMVRMLGLPPSIGAIYGLLYISENPLSLDDLVRQLGISKGSASQGLAVLKKLGALRPVQIAGRRDYFSADTALKKLVGGFLHSEVMPNLERGGTTAAKLLQQVETLDASEKRAFLQERVERLIFWQRRGSQILGLLHRFLD